MAVGISELAGVVGSVFTRASLSTGYATLEKPALNPASWTFAPIWVALYFLMGLAGFLVWQKGLKRKDVKVALGVFGIQLVLNAVWSIIFFGWQSPVWALVEIILLWLAIAGTIIVFYKISQPAAFLLLPYILWVSFAVYLNYTIWQLNTNNPSASIVCTRQLKLCSDGSYVGRIAPACGFAPCPKDELIQVESPKVNEKISSPLHIKGKARGFWFFEADFPVKLLDDDEEVIAESIAQAQGDWVTEDFVPFAATLDFKAPEADRGFLVLEKDNPSGLAENYNELKIPVIFWANRTVKLYYYNDELDKDGSGHTLCSRKGLIAVERELPMPISQTPLQDTIELLLTRDLTFEERAQGLVSEYPLEGLVLKNTSLKDGVLTLEFDDPQNKTTGGSCRVGILWFQIEATAKQFPDVEQVRFLPEEIFQP